MSDCKFCSLLATPDLGTALPNLLLQTDHMVVALNRRPITPGHLTIILKAHYAHTSDCRDDHLTGLGGLLGRLSRALEKLHVPQRVVLLSDGKRSAHLHLHVIPEPFGSNLDLGAIVTDLNQPTRPATLTDAETAATLERLRAILAP